MSSSITEPYKSRLFNFLNRQAIQIGDRLGKAFRHIKVATEWGVQVVIYPVYLMVQAGRSLGRQLGQKLEQSALPSSSSDLEDRSLSVTVDRPIEGILKEIEPWLETQCEKIEEDNNQSNLAAVATTEIINRNLEIRGIANLLETRNLVLVDRNNQILDLLSLEQQQQLQKRITWNIANFHRDRSLIQSKKRGILGFLPSINLENTNVLPPFRLLWQVIDWVQTSQIATSINLFGESNLLPANSSTPIDSQTIVLPRSGIICSLDRTIANLETKPIAIATEIVDKISENLQEIIVQRQDISKDRRLSISVFSSNKNWHSPRSQNELDRSNPFQIKFILQAAIDYFFGKNKGQSTQKIAGNVTQNHSLSGKQQLSPLPSSANSEWEEDPWLSWSDLFENPTVEASNQSPHLPQQKSSAKLLDMAKVPSNKFDRSSIASKLKQQNSRSLKVRSSQSTQITKSESKPTEIIDFPRSDRSFKIPESEDFITDTEYDWLDANATPVGYEKHPLERILELLDRVMVWFEEQFLQIWQKIIGRNRK